MQKPSSKDLSYKMPQKVLQSKKNAKTVPKIPKTSENHFAQKNSSCIFLGVVFRENHENYDYNSLKLRLPLQNRVMCNVICKTH